MAHPLPMTSGDEQDAFSPAARKAIASLHRAGVVAKTKTRYNRRVRRTAKAEIAAQLY
jgi:hypothetical protein